MLYPPADIASVTIPADGRGCGQVHKRPETPDGRPVHPWGLSCGGGCEDFLLRTDSRWARTIAEIPLTYDQAKEQEHLALRGTTDRDSILTLALAKLAGLDVTQLPASITGPALAAAPVAGLIACPSCQRAQPAGHAYCASCGTGMRSAVPAAGIGPGAA
jgi:hypothetical protein